MYMLYCIAPGFYSMHVLRRGLTCVHESDHWCHCGYVNLCMHVGPSLVCVYVHAWCSHVVIKIISRCCNAVYWMYIIILLYSCYTSLYLCIMCSTFHIHIHIRNWIHSYTTGVYWFPVLHTCYRWVTLRWGRCLPTLRQCEPWCRSGVVSEPAGAAC